MNWRKRKPRNALEDFGARWPSMPSQVAQACARFSTVWALSILRLLYERQGDVSVAALTKMQTLSASLPEPYDMDAYQADGATWAKWSQANGISTALPCAILLAGLPREEITATEQIVKEAEENPDSFLADLNNTAGE